HRRYFRWNFHGSECLGGSSGGAPSGYGRQENRHRRRERGRAFFEHVVGGESPSGSDSVRRSICEISASGSCEWAGGFFVFAKSKIRSSAMCKLRVKWVQDDGCFPGEEV